MNIITGDGHGVVFMNVFTVRPENQEALVACIREGAPRDTRRTRPEGRTVNHRDPAIDRGDDHHEPAIDR
jgi:hypothetical protein